MVKKIKMLTVEDLYKFCLENNFAKFSAKESGYQLAVQVPTTFEVDDTSDDNHRGMMRLKFRILHDGRNRNGSFVPHSAAVKASNTIADRPIMAVIHQLDDGSWDFKSHEMEIIQNEDGEEETVYIEKQVGSFSSEKPFWEHDEKLDKDYLCAYGYVAEEYTKAADIIREKGWTKNSCELVIEEMAFNAKEKQLELNAFYLSASTLLGREDDGTPIGEGMLGSRADIADFSVKNNSILAQNEQVIKLLSELNEKIDGLNINQTSLKEGGKNPLFEELLKKYSKTIEEIDFEYEGLSDEELEALFAEHFAETPKKRKKGEDDDVTPSGEDDGDDSEDEDDDKDDDDDQKDDDDQPNQNVEQNQQQEEQPEEPVENPEEVDYYSVTISKGDMSKTFSVSLQDKIEALYTLVNNTYADADGDFYDVLVYEDSKEVVMRGWWSGKAYRQSYKVKKETYTLVDDRVEVKAVYVTADEEKALDAMKANYSSIESELASFKAEPEKQAVLAEECYAQIADTEAYKKLAERDAHFNMSVDEVRAELDKQLLEYAKGHKVEFSAKEEPKKEIGMKLFGSPTKKAGTKTGRYGGLFSK